LLSVSIVIYGPLNRDLAVTLHSLDGTLSQFKRDGVPSKVYLINNNAEPLRLGELARHGFESFGAGVELELIEGHGNVGYGRGHNLAIERTRSDYHLILNPDVEMSADTFPAAFAFLAVHPEVGLLAPSIRGDDGELQYLCRRFPTVIDLALRGFAPPAWRKLFARRLARYEMKDQIGPDQIVFDPPIVSGCFMLFRTAVLHQISGFDPRYFLYFEDYDLSLRTGQVTRIAYVPAVKIVHFGGGASRKGWQHIKMFAASAFKFYSRFGWRLA